MTACNKPSRIISGCLTVGLMLTVSTGAYATDSAHSTGKAESSIHLLPTNVQLGQLENGMQVMLVHNPTSTMSGVNLQVHAGAVFEDYHTSGMSHMLEHLLFNGTTSRTQEQLYDDIDSISGYINANTAGTYVNYMVVIPADQLIAGMDIQSDMLFNSVMPVEKFEKERGIVLEELVQGRNDPSYKSNTLIDRQIFAGTSMSMPVLGTISTIENMDRDDVWAFYKNLYVPNNMQLSVVGSFDPDSIWQQLERYYGAPPAREVIFPEIKELGPLTVDQVTSRWVEGLPELNLIFNAPAYREADYPPFEVLLEVLASSSNPVSKILKDNGVPLLEISHMHYPNKGFSRLQMSFSFSEEIDINAVLPLIDQALNSMANNLQLEENLIRSIVNTRLTEELRLVERPHSLGMFKGDLLANAGFEYLYDLTHQIQSVDKHQLQQIVGKYIANQPRQIIAFSSLPEVEENDDSQTLLTERIALDNGSTLIALDRGASDLFALHLLFRNRSLNEPAGKEGIVNLLHELLLTVDPDNLTEDPELRFSEFGIIAKTVDSPWIPYDDYYTNGSFSFVRLECRRQQAEDAIRLMTEILYDREFTAEMLQSAKETVLSRLRRDKSSPRTIARKQFRELLMGDHPLTQPVYGTAESLDNISLAEINELRAQYFNPGNIIFSVVSAIPAQEVATMLASSLPDLQLAPSMELPQAPLTLNAASDTIEVGGEQAYVYLGYITEIDPDNGYALQLLGSIISNRIAMDLRETRGLAYSVGAWISADGDRAEVGSYMGTRSENLEEVLPVLRQSITGFDADDVTESELEIAKQAILGRQQMRLLTSIGQAYSLGTGELDGDFLRSIEIFDRYQAVTLDEVRSVSSYLGTKPLVEVIAK
jgi:zinc protease